MARRNGNDEAAEKSSRAAAVMATDADVMHIVENRLEILAYRRLLRTVPPQTVAAMMPAHDTGTPRSGYIIGHAVPSIESGSPSEMNAI